MSGRNTAENAALKEQRAAFEKERELQSQLITRRDDPKENKFELPKPGDPSLFRDPPHQQTHDVTVRDSTLLMEPAPPPSISGFDVPYDTHELMYSNASAPKVSFREATEGVPSFDGYNISLAQFTRACRRAKDIVPPASERNLTKLLISKLRGRAYYAVEDEPCDSVTQLIDLLNGAFGPSKTIDQYRGELSTVYLRPQEHVLDYISRVKDLRTAILDAERRDRGLVESRFLTDIEGLTARSFCEGLPLEYRLQLSAEMYSRPSEAFARVKAIAKRQELDKQRFEVRRTERETYRREQPVHPIGRPVAHSTPKSYNNNAGSRWNNQRFDRGPADRYTPPRPRQDLPARRETTTTAEKVCRYCKNRGHTIEECRKRQYNNSQRQQSGNASTPTGRPDAARSDDRRNTRPIQTISVANNENDQSSKEPEQQS